MKPMVSGHWEEARGMAKGGEAGGGCWPGGYFHFTIMFTGINAVTQSLILPQLQLVRPCLLLFPQALLFSVCKNFV